MNVKIQQIAIISLAIATTSLAACGGKSTSTGAAASAPATSAADDTTAPTTVPATTAPPATTAVTAPPGHQLYDVVGLPELPDDFTDSFDLDVRPLEDGAYWVVYNGGDTHSPTVKIFQALFGQYCIDYVDEVNTLYLANIECINNMTVPIEFGYDTLYPGEPNPVVNDLPFADDVFLTVSDASTQSSYWITPEELVQLRDATPSAGAPVGYTFVPFGFLMTIKDGVIVKFEQVWTP